MEIQTKTTFWETPTPEKIEKIIMISMIPNYILAVYGIIQETYFLIILGMIWIIIHQIILHSYRKYQKKIHEKQE